MLDEIRFTTTDPARLTTELDRFVRSVRLELESVERKAMQRFDLRPIVHGKTGEVVSTTVALGELVRLSPSQGAIAAQLPRVTPREAGRTLAVLVRSAAFAVTLYPGAGGTVNLASSLALPTAVGAYLLICDDSGFWAVNDAV